MRTFTGCRVCQRRSDEKYKVILQGILKWECENLEGERRLKAKRRNLQGERRVEKEGVESESGLERELFFFEDQRKKNTIKLSRF